MRRSATYVSQEDHSRLYPTPMPKSVYERDWRSLRTFRCAHLIVKYSAVQHCSIGDLTQTPKSAGPYLGFVIRRKNGNAVLRNKLRRQLRHLWLRSLQLDSSLSTRKGVAIVVLNADVRLSRQNMRAIAAEFESFLNHRSLRSICAAPEGQS